ncbi:NAD-P-binding protein [Russula emetica]|nr:NAD-P-binding protein [Russula emetica]
MSGYTNFAVAGAGAIGSYIVQQLLKDKAAGIIKEVIVLSRQVNYPSNDQTIHDMLSTSLSVIQVDYSNDASIKHALTGVDVVISTVPTAAFDVQWKVATAAKEVDVKSFVPSQFGGISEGASEGRTFSQTQLKALGLPYTAFYTGAFAGEIWAPFIKLDLTSGKVSIGGDGNKPFPFTSRTDIARYVSYVLTHLPSEQLKNRSFTMAGDNKTFNEVFKAYEEKTGKKPEVTYIPVSELDARIAANPHDFPSLLHKLLATIGPFPRTDNHLYPDRNPTPVFDNLPIA